MLAQLCPDAPTGPALAAPHRPRCRCLPCAGVPRRSRQSLGGSPAAVLPGEYRSFYDRNIYPRNGWVNRRSVGRGQQICSDFCFSFFLSQELSSCLSEQAATKPRPFPGFQTIYCDPGPAHAGCCCVSPRCQAPNQAHPLGITSVTRLWLCTV